MIGKAKTLVGLGPSNAATAPSTQELAAKKDANTERPGIDEAPLLAASHQPGPAGAKVAYGKLVKVAIGIVVTLGLVCYATGAHLAVVQIATTIASSPKGSLTTPKGIISLCGSIQKVAVGNLLPVTVALLILYLTLQTFCIPGTIALNAMMGALLGVKMGLPLCVLAGTVGASCCYTLSSVAGAKFAEAVDHKLLQGRGIPKLRAQVLRYRAELFSYLLFLRLTPILPNWLINLASPVVHVPLKSFALATMVGITPQTYLSVRFGTIVNAESVSSIVTPWDTLAIAALGLLVLFIGRLKKKFGGGQAGNVPATTVAAPQGATATTGRTSSPTQPSVLQLPNPTGTAKKTTKKIIEI